MTPTQKKELLEKFTFFLVFLLGMSILSILIMKAWEVEAKKISKEKHRIEQSVKVHDYSDQIN